jgi:response regulator RpfG family c-di-GMP phosphodiesterase
MCKKVSFRGEGAVKYFVSSPGMPKNIKTHIYCFDDHRGFSEEVKKRFPDNARYTVLSFQTREEFIRHLETEKENHFCKIAILGLHDTKEQFEMIDQLTMEIKRIDQLTGLILVGPPDKIDIIKKTVKFNIDAYIPKNTNSILRIHNSVKKLISEHGLVILKKRRNVSFYLLLGFILISIALIIAARFRFPQFF